MATDLEDMKDSFRELKVCAEHAHMQSSKIRMSSSSSWINPSESGNVSLFSFPCGSSNDVTLKVKKIDIFVSSSKNMNKKTEIAAISIFGWLLMEFEFSTHNYIFLPNFAFSPRLKQLR